MKCRRISIEEIRNVLSSVFEHYQDKVIFAYIFGSMVQETPYPAKDIDIAVFFQQGSLESYIDSRLSLYADICRALKTNDVDLVILNTTTNLMLMEEIVRNGDILYDKRPDLRMDFELKILHQVIDFREQRYVTMGI